MKATINDGVGVGFAAREGARDGDLKRILTPQAFLRTCLGILIATSGAKFLTMAVGSPILDLRDPVFPFMSTRQMLAGAAGAELALSFWLIWSRRAREKLLFVAVISGLFIAYRAGLYFDTGSFSGAMCPCLGSLGDWLHLSRRAQNLALNAVALYLLAGSAGFLLHSKNRSLPSHHDQP